MATATARSAVPTATTSPPVAELREPNLPASARRVATARRRSGWTTGPGAAAAAKAAALLLRDGDPPADVEVPLPKGERRPTFPVERCERAGDAAVAVVVKDAGD